MALTIHIHLELWSLWMMAEVQVQPRSKYLQQNKVYKTVIWLAGVHGCENSKGAQFEKKSI